MKLENYQVYKRRRDMAKLEGANPLRMPPSDSPGPGRKAELDYIWRVFNWRSGFSALAALEILAREYTGNDWWLLFVVVIIVFIMFMSGAFLMFFIIYPRFKSEWPFTIVASILFLSYGSAIFRLGWPLIISLKRYWLC